MFQNIIKDINIEQFIQVEFWFRNPGPASLGEFIFWLTLFSATFLFGISIFIFNKFKIGHYPPKNRILNPAGIGLIITGIFGEIFSLFRWQGIDFLGVRAVLLLILIASFFWISYIFFLYRHRVPNQSIDYEARAIKKKYLGK